MTTEASLKTKNIGAIWLFFLFNLAVLVSLFFAANFNAIVNDYKSLLSIRTFGVLIAPLLVFILNGILSSDFKATIIYWRFSNPLPGCRAFSHHAHKDYRVDVNNLQVKYGILPTDAKAQNVLWYKMFKTHREDIAIQKSHKDFLLSRDLCSIAFLCLCLLGLPFLFIGDKPYNWIYFLFLIGQYLLMVLVSQNYGKRFVCNVLALEGI